MKFKRTLGVLAAGIFALSSVGAVDASAASTPESAYLPRNHQKQQYDNWCGPASMSMALDYMGVKVSQRTLASQVGVPAGGSIGTSMAKMQTVLNSYGKSRGFAWDRQYVAENPTSAELAKYRSDYKNRLKTDILGRTKSGNKYPLIMNVNIRQGDTRAPKGYPIHRRSVRHYFVVRGYKGNGEWSQIQDPATSVWSGVDAHYPLLSNTLVDFTRSRGYLY